MRDNNHILELDNIRASYYKKEILHGVSLFVRKGEILTVIGPNGAGKSTLLKVIIGILEPKEGKIFLEKEDVTKLACHQRVRKGIGYFIQGGEVFPNLAVLENLELGGAEQKRKGLQEKLDDIYKIFPELKRIQTQRAGLLSGGQRQALALGIILMRRPKLLLLDEPSAGLAPSLVKETMRKIKGINRNQGTTVILVEQNLKEALRIAQRAYFVKAGQIVGEENISEASDIGDEKLEELFIGKMWA